MREEQLKKWKELALQTEEHRVRERLVREGIGERMHQIVEAAIANPEAFDIDPDEAYGWGEVEDWEEAVRSHLLACEDVDELERAAEKVGDWEDVKDAAGVPEVVEIEGDQYQFEGCVQRFDDEDDALEAAVLSVSDKIVEEIFDLTCEGEWEDIGRELDIEPDTREVYEYWSVTDLCMEQFLRGHGEQVFDLCGVTVWGRTTTGQSISMDCWVRKYAEDVSEYWEGWEDIMRVGTYSVTVGDSVYIMHDAFQVVKDWADFTFGEEACISHWYGDKPMKVVSE